MRAAHEVLGRHGIEVVALEIASNDAIYDWREEQAPTPYPRETLFPGRNYDNLTPEQLHTVTTEALDKLNPDAVHIHSYATPDARACLAWCRRHRRVAVCMAESKESDAPRIWWRERLKHVIASEFDAAQASGSPGTRYAVKLGIPASRIFIGYSVVDNEYFAEHALIAQNDPSGVRHLPGLGDPTPFFFASARFIERKNLPALLHAYARYRRESPEPWRLVLIGDGPLRPQLEQIIADEQIEGITLAGWMQIEHLPSYYGLASAFVHTAEVDQWGLVVNEAMAAGLPVIVSTGTGCSEDLVHDGENGFTFRPDDIATLARHLYAVAHEVDRDGFAQRSREIIAEWPLERFGTSLHQAVEAGAEVADRRGFSLLARAALWALRKASRSITSFHSIAR
ncbi:MAG: glycosyltransferase family 4 protein [Rhodothermales bacterium]